MGASESTRRNTSVISASTDAIRTGPGRLKGIILTPAAALVSINIRDSLTATAGTIIANLGVQYSATLSISTGAGWYPLDINFETGLSVQITGAITITLVYE